MVYDLIICGAGPAGINAASHAGSAGLKTLLFDKARFPRQKICGGGLVSRAEDFLLFNVDAVIEKTFKEIEINFPHYNYSYTLKKDVPLIKTVSRETFDKYVLDQCLNRVQFDFNEETTLKEIAFSNPLVITTSKGKFRTRFLIAADGANSKVLKICKLKHSAYRAPAVECEIQFDDIRTEEIQNLRFDLGFPSKGYSWIFPKSDKISLGAGRFYPTKEKINLKGLLIDYIDHCGIKLKRNKAPEIHGGVIPITRGMTNLYHQNILFTGDSAGLADPITAEGLSSAMLSGKAATEAVIQSDFDPDKTALNYHKYISRNILKYNRSASRLAWFLYNNKWPASWAVQNRAAYLSDKLADVFLGNHKLPGNLFFFINSAIRAAFKKA